MHTIEVFRDLEFSSLQVFVNDRLEISGEHVYTGQACFDDTVANIRVEYQPQNTLPKIRINGFLINTWLADAVNSPAGFSLTVDSEFAKRYKAKDIQGAINSLPQKEQSAPELFDKFIGINNLYPELVAEIRTTLKL